LERYQHIDPNLIPIAIAIPNKPITIVGDINHKNCRFK
jgi:hypothetical protein